MNASSSDACCGVSSCRTMPCRAAASPICCAVRPCTSMTPRLERDDGDVGAARRARASSSACGVRTRTTLPDACSQELRGRRVGDQPSAPDDDQVVGGQRHLAHQMRGDEHGAALAREVLQEIADPVDAFRVEAVDRLVEHHRSRVAEERSGDAEPLAHAERELARALLRDLAQADEVDQLVDAAARRSRASARARADGCTPNVRCGRSAPRAARRLRAAARRGRGSACR